MYVADSNKNKNVLDCIKITNEKSLKKYFQINIRTDMQDKIINISV